MTTPKLQLPELVVGQSGKELTHNQALAILSQLVQANVVDKDLADPPVSPADGAMYLVAASATGAWAGKSGQLAFWLASVGAWTFAVPANGWRVWVTDEAAHYTRKAGTWTIDSSGNVSGPASAADGNLALFDGATGKLIKDGGVITAAGKALLDDSDAAAQRTTLGLGTAATANILGTVSQSAGVPTGAIIERGSNANGEYVRFADGTQICSGRSSGGIGSAATYGSGLYYYLKPLTWPASFSGIPAFSGYGTDDSNLGLIGGYAIGLYSGQLVYITPNASVISANIGWTAIGRWF